MEGRIWTEIKQSKKNHFYCIYLMSYKRRFLIWFNVFILTFSAGGAMGWSIWSRPYLAGIACTVIAITTLIKQMELYIIPSEKEIDKLDTVINFYFDYNNKLEVLWLDYFNERITDKEAQEIFYKIKESEKPTNQLINEVIKRSYKKINKKAEENTVSYLKSIFNC